MECQPNKGALGKAFKANAKAVSEHLSRLEAEAVEKLEKELNDNG